MQLMTTLAREFNQENLVIVSKAEMRSVERSVEQNNHLAKTRNSTYSADKTGAFCKDQNNNYLYVSHFVSTDDGLKIVYKVDKDLLEEFQSRKQAKK